MDFIQNIISPLTTGLFAFAAAYLTFNLSNRAEKKRKIFNKKFDLYTDFLALVSKAAAQGDSKELQASLMNINQKMLLICSKEIISLMKILRPFDLSIAEKYDAFTELIIIMRKDLGLNSIDVDKSDIDALLK